MHKLFTYLKVAAISGTAVLLSVPFAMQAAMPDPAGSVYNPDSYRLYQPGQANIEDSPFVALPIEGLRMKDLQGADQGDLSIGSVFSYPQDRNWLVFSVKVNSPDYSTQNLQAGATNFKVFRYNLSTGQLQRIYREFATSDSMGNFMLMGFDGAKLIIGKTGTDNSLGPCSNLWQNMSVDHYSLDMRTPWKGLTEYKVPKKLIDQSVIETAACEKAI